MKRNISRLTLLSCLAALLTVASPAVAVMNDYCIQPPFINAPIQPNLLLLIDNSASMFDLAYVDEGNKSNGTFIREPYYCYDQTFSSTREGGYEGYFNKTANYQYDFSTGYFTEVGSVPTTCSMAEGGTVMCKKIDGILLVNIDTGDSTKPRYFYATGSYLNWLTASKFDIEKKVLTGGKYVDKACYDNTGKRTDRACLSNTDCKDGETCTDVTNFLQPESRGCVGQGFVKEANKSDFVNFTGCLENPNDALGLTFVVQGPDAPYNPSAPSQGGQTYINIFKGNYNQCNCQDAINALVTGGNADIKKSVDLCLASTGVANGYCQKNTTMSCATSSDCLVSTTQGKCSGDGSALSCMADADCNVKIKGKYYDYAPCTGAVVGTDNGPCVLPPQSAQTKTKVSFAQSMQACWQYREGKGIGIDDINTVRNQCTDIYASLYTCSNNHKKICTADADCGGGTCMNGPTSIVPGNPGLLCSQDYEGQYYEKVSGAWLLKAGVTTTQMIETHEKFCNDFNKPNVTDPTDAPSDTALYDNVPAILSGIGVEGQLGESVARLAVRIASVTAPTRLIQSYADRIRFGVMEFNFNGSASETATVGIPKVCSNDPFLVCTDNVDCGDGNTCQATTAGTNNFDGGKISSEIGRGTCSATTTTECATDFNCPSGEHCVPAGVGSHGIDKSPIDVIDKLRAATWTPFSEAFYNAIGYFAKDLTTDPSGKTSRSDLRLSSDETKSFKLTMNPVQYRCQSNNILIISDGMSTADQNSSVNSLAQLYTAAGGETGACSQYAGSKNLDNLAWLAHNRDIQEFSTSTASTKVPSEISHGINTYVVFTGASNGQAGECNSETLMYQTALKGRSVKEGQTVLFKAERFDELETQLKNVFDSVANTTASGTAASILSNSEGSGASILQAVFYPKKIFANDTSAYWLGEMQNLWYYIDPNIGKSTVREDTDYDGSTRKLNLLNDKVVEFYFDNTDSKTYAKLTQDTNGDGAGDGTPKTGVDPDDIKSIWRAGNQLWSRDLTSSPRNIVTSCLKDTCAENEKIMAFSTGNASTLRPYLDVTDDTKAANVIQYVHGVDVSGFRSRTVTTKNFLTGNIESHVWKLGDIISSTPRILSPLRLNTYHLSLPSGYNDASYASFLGSNEYKKRNLAFVGANDGMLHAFRLGTMDVRASGFTKATLTGSDIGKEVWAFIPKHTLPYIKYLTTDDYSHLFFVDGPTLIFDASIGVINGCTDYWDCVKPPKVVDENKNLDSTKNPWRTILIGSMGLGGAAKSALASCTADLTGDGVLDGKDCVKTPITDPKAGTEGFGYSSYFAFDFTDQDDPKLLWEFSDPNLGFSTTGPAIIRVGDPMKNGKWFAVFASGPTGPIDTGTHQFLGRSDQPLRLFVVDLVTGELATIEKTADNKTIDNAFAGSLVGSAIDTDRWNSMSTGLYKDDTLYFGYVQKDTTAGTWTKGGVLRLMTGDNPDPTKWKLSPVIEDTGPVTSAIGRLQDRKNKNLWLYFGTGRYFFKKTTDNQTDDFGTQQALYGIKEPCYMSSNALDGSCTTTVKKSELTDQTTDVADDLDVSGTRGWFIKLDNAGGGYGAERVVSDPTTLTNGLVLFTSFSPTGDPCGFGGNSYLWALKYNTGYQGPVKALEGKVLIQLSTGAFVEKDLSTTFTDKEKRRSGGAMQGKPPGDQNLVITKSANRPVKKILHIRER